jgi:transposase InsO family protein
MFIRNYATVTEPFTRLLRKDEDFVIGQQHHEALQKLKESLSQIVLAWPMGEDGKCEQDGTFLLETDASEVGIGAVLSYKTKEGVRPVQFAARTLKPNERKWSTRDREAYAVFWALNHFDEFLRGRQFKLQTDHKALEWVFQAKKGRVARWAQLFQEFKMDIGWKAGKEIPHADCLSRMVPEEPFLQDRMVYATQALPKLQDIQSTAELESPHGRGFKKQEGIWQYKEKVYVPAAQREAILHYYHGSPLGGHSGIRKTIQKIRRLFDWPTLAADVEQMIRRCLSCGRTKLTCEKTQGLLRPHPSRGPFDVLYYDLWGPTTVEGEPVMALTMIDGHTRWVEATFLPNKKAKTIARALMQHWITRFGVPEVILCDNEASFREQVVEELEMLLGAKVLHSSPYHPQGNALVESFHRTLRASLATLKRTSPHLDAEERLQLALYAYRIAPHETLGDSPAFVTFGIDIGLPVERNASSITNGENRGRLQFLNEVRMEVMCRAQHLRAKAVEKENNHRIARQLQEGLLVLVRLRPSELDTLAKFDKGRKLLPKWSLPARIITVCSPTTAIIKNLLTRKLTKAHIEDIKFIIPPATEEERRQWETEVNWEFRNIAFDPDLRTTALQNFWEEVDNIEAPVTLSRPAKRRRTELEGGFDVPRGT